jgi:hypothetical protein
VRNRFNSLIILVVFALSACHTSKEFAAEPGCAFRPIYQAEWDRVWIARVTMVTYGPSEMSVPHAGRFAFRDFVLEPERSVKGPQEVLRRQVQDVATFGCTPEPMIQSGDRVAVYEQGFADKPGHFAMVRLLSEARQRDRILSRQH